VVYSVQSEDRRGVVCCAMVLQYYCNRVGNAGGGGATKGCFIRAHKPRSKRISCKGQSRTGIDGQWVPMRKTWRLNERMYGALTGLSKKKTRAQYGDVQFKKWRRGYTTRPPAVSSFSGNYPGNDKRCAPPRPARPPRRLSPAPYTQRPAVNRSIDIHK